MMQLGRGFLRGSLPMVSPAVVEGRQSVNSNSSSARSSSCRDAGGRADALEHFRSLFEVSEARTPAALEAAYRLRYQVYCVENAFERQDSNPGSRETDRFDWHSVHSILTHRESQQVVGTLRLVLPIGGTLPIQELHPNPLDQIKEFVPLETTAEVSRFAVSKSFRRRRGEERYPDVNWQGPDQREQNGKMRRLMPYLSVGLLQGVIRLSVRHGVTHLCAIIDPSLLRLLGRFGLHFQPIGEPVDYHGLRQPCYAELEELIRSAAEEQPDIWALGTEGGSLLKGEHDFSSI